MILINNKTDIRFLEDAYSQLSSNPSIDISISKKISLKDFGLIPAIIQFFATWHTVTTDGKIILEIKSTEELPEFYELDFLFPSLVYCWNREIVDSNGTNLKPLLKLQNQFIHDKMKKQVAGGGYKTMLTCFDHLSIKNGLLNAFYTDGLFILNEWLFELAIGKAIRQVTSLNHSLRNSTLGPVYDDVIAIIFELMKNTDDWGRTDEFHKPLNPNTRGLFLNLHRRTRDSFSGWFENNEGLKNYFSDSDLQGNGQDELYFLELSVYDTGIGFVRRNVGESYNAFDSFNQVEVVRNCMVRNVTSAIGIEKDIKGQGLDRIMRILDNKGLFWLRTQNISVFRNLRENRYKDETKATDIELFDWFNNSSKTFSSLQSTIGSVITLVYPISNVSNA